MERPISDTEKELLVECIMSSTLGFKAKKNLLAQLDLLAVADKYYCEQNKGKTIIFHGCNKERAIKACEVTHKKNKKLLLEVDLPELRITSLSIRACS